MFKRVLVANRGEIATRIIRALRELEITSVGIYSEADATSMHIQLADEAYPIGPPDPANSYLDIERLIECARAANVDAIHPGYGFLSENPKLARACADAGIGFIGPPAEAMEKLSHKTYSKKVMKEAGIPILPGTGNLPDSEEEALESVRKIGFPVMIKADMGGGGRGMRIVRKEEEFKEALSLSRSEAQAAFASHDVFVEKYLVGPRHIEFQVMADTHGNIAHLGERDCSLQRRHQKLSEFAPSLVLTDEKREEIGLAACRAVKSTGYCGAATVEFLFDSDLNYYFLEVNTRIQVEHTITEMITGIDLVKEQIRIAAGEPLTFTQDDVRLSGHAIQFRINAEDPKRNFMPAPGKIVGYHSPGGFGIRLDGAIYANYTLPEYYDNMIIKLSIWGRDRKEALARARRALWEFHIDGINTTIPFFRNLLKRDEFKSAEFTTDWLENHIEDLTEFTEVEPHSDIHWEHGWETLGKWDDGIEEDTLMAIVGGAVSAFLGLTPMELTAAKPESMSENLWADIGKLKNTGRWIPFGASYEKRF